MGTMNKKVYLLEDDTSICELVQCALEMSGIELSAYNTVYEFWAALEKSAPSLALLDIMLPDGNGLEVLAKIKQKYPQVSCIMLSALGQETDKVRGLNLGADDYIVKPFSPREVLARIKAVLRRFSEKASDEDSTIIRLPQLEISLENYQVKAAGKVIPCTPKEVEILHMLTSNVGQVFSREQILSRVWGYDYFGDTRTVDAHIKRIRQKLPQENVPWALKTVYGVGYRFEVNT